MGYLPFQSKSKQMLRVCVKFRVSMPLARGPCTVHTAVHISVTATGVVQAPNGPTRCTWPSPSASSSPKSPRRATISLGGFGRKKSRSGRDEPDGGAEADSRR